MKEIRAIVKAWQSIDFSSTRAALATVVRVEGSSYRRAGARMLVLDDGNYLGGISGGCLEGDALRRAQKAIGLHHPSVVTYDTTQEDDHQVGVGLGCQGIIDVLFTPLDANDPGNPVRILEGLTDLREPACLVTITGGTTGLGQTFLFDEGTFLRLLPFPDLAADVLRDIRDCRASLQSRSLSYADGVTLFIEIVLPAIHVVAYGSNNDIYPFLQIARELGWDTTIVTNILRADKRLFGIAGRVLDHKGSDLPRVDAHTAVLLMTHDYRTDLQRLPEVLQTPASYIGILGPRQRTERMYRTLDEEGRPVGEADRQRIYSPAGLDIGSGTPEEIALSILAEIRAHFASRPGTSLRLRTGTIYSER